MQEKPNLVTSGKQITSQKIVADALLLWTMCACRRLYAVDSNKGAFDGLAEAAAAPNESTEEGGGTQQTHDEGWWWVAEFIHIKIAIRPRFSASVKPSAICKEI